MSLDVQSSRTDSLPEAEPENENSVVGNDIQAGSESEISTEVSSASDAAEMTSAADPVSDDSSSDDSTSSDANETSGNSADASATDVVAADPVAAAVTDEPADTDAVVSTEMDSSSEVDSVSGSAPAQAQAGTREQPARIAPSGSDKLQLIINADTWADVKDANNYQLVYDLLRADSSIELSGEAPFSIFLGNGHGIEIRFNGEEIGFANRVRDDNTARLRIGG